MANTFEQLEQMRQALQESLPNGPADLETACSLADLACQAVALLAHRPPVWNRGYGSDPKWLLEVPDWLEEPEQDIAKASKATRQLSSTLHECSREARMEKWRAAKEAAEEAAAAAEAPPEAALWDAAAYGAQAINARLQLDPASCEAVRHAIAGALGLAEMEGVEALAEVA